MSTRQKSFLVDPSRICPVHVKQYLKRNQKSTPRVVDVTLPMPRYVFPAIAPNKRQLKATQFHPQ